MKRIGIVVGLTLAVGIALGVIGMQILNAQVPITRTELMKTDLEGIDGKEVKVAVIDWAPGVASGKHYHPEYEFAYIIAGSITVEPEGQAPVTFGPGQVVYNPLNRVHVAKNPGTTESLKMVQFIISQKGQPALVPVK